MTETLRRDPATTCQWDVAEPDEFPGPCDAISQFVVERSDGDTSFGWDGKHEACEYHLAEVVAGMADGDDQVRAVVAIRWWDDREGCPCPCGCPATGRRDDDGTPGWCDSCRMNIH